jgi:hypothetical protein
MKNEEWKNKVKKSLKEMQVYYSLFITTIGSDRT